MTPTGTITAAESRQAVQRRTLTVVMASQVFSGAGVAAGATVAALLAEDMLGTTSLSGLPTALFTAGSAATALIAGRLSQRFGRRAGLASGYAVGALGGAGVVLAATLDNVLLLLVSLLFYGAGTATNLQARYAGTDLAHPTRRGRAVSTVLVATTIGAVAGPNLVGVTGTVADRWGLPPLAGLFALAAIAYAIAGVILVLLLRPDPLLFSRTTPASAATTAGTEQGRRRRFAGTVTTGAVTMVLAQLVMVAVMTMTPVHMHAHGHDLNATGLVIAVHIGAMYLPSPITGILVDRIGRVPVAIASGLTLLTSGIVAATAPEESVILLVLALALLGLGWNLGVISGTAMITDAAPACTRAKTQGAVDVCVALAGAGAGITSGMIMTATSYATLSIAGGLLALAVISFVLASSRRAAKAAADECNATRARQ
ncbi:MFS transporter [Actinoplanes sp. N902-109]|uniref:MFS transporter n=1 Tax=Actinoplanes sp. (strain N902-109) TaxID=649831 RepID=UPI0003296404|nr:MFS transporter [Actinoplanes sp. N902-109]AGL16173.1 putative permease [Actinoplanes sp. N902-109]